MALVIIILWATKRKSKLRPGLRTKEPLLKEITSIELIERKIRGTPVRGPSKKIVPGPEL